MQTLLVLLYHLVVNFSHCFTSVLSLQFKNKNLQKGDKNPHKLHKKNHRNTEELTQMHENTRIAE